ncbi:MAG: YihA family ribosome biogenesis GTP-binding protein [Candidatus Izimaplasma sp.]|nr:YihA family ribosome biogenesis GTP-binding protein [Candidatus Izimaplasma bacterium]
MIIHSVDFKGSHTELDKCPLGDLPEIVIAGRSNVGKSSFINSFLNRKNIAHTSGRPGKTQTLNFYLVNELFHFVDVPGYGYARVSKTDREKFGLMIEDYLLNRENLRLVILLVDFRHKPSEDDYLMYNFLKSYDIPCLVVGTKQDKISKNQQPKQEKIIKTELKLATNDYFVGYSSVLKTNRDKIANIIESYVE